MRVNRHQGRECRLTLVVKMERQLFNCWTLKKSPQRQIDGEFLLNEGDQANSQKGMTTQLEKVVINPDFFHIKDFTPDRS